MCRFAFGLNIWFPTNLQKKTCELGVGFRKFFFEPPPEIGRKSSIPFGNFHTTVFGLFMKTLKSPKTVVLDFAIPKRGAHAAPRPKVRGTPLAGWLGWGYAPCWLAWFGVCPLLVGLVRGAPLTGWLGSGYFFGSRLARGLAEFKKHLSNLRVSRNILRNCELRVQFLKARIS